MANIGFSQRRTLALPVRLGAGPGRPGAGASLRPLQRQPRPLRRRLDGGDGGLRRGGARRQRLPARRARDPQAARFRLRQLVGLRGPAARPGEEVDAGVARELETGSFAAVDPETGEFEAIDPDTGEFEAIEQSDALEGDSGSPWRSEARTALTERSRAPHARRPGRDRRRSRESGITQFRIYSAAPLAPACAGPERLSVPLRPDRPDVPSRVRQPR